MRDGRPWADLFSMKYFRWAFLPGGLPRPALLPKNLPAVSRDVTQGVEGGAA